jgi:hypothetical protein
MAPPMEQVGRPTVQVASRLQEGDRLLADCQCGKRNQ